MLVYMTCDCTCINFVGNFPFSQLFVMDMALSVCACVITNRRNSPMKDNQTSWWHRKFQNTSWRMHDCKWGCTIYKKVTLWKYEFELYYYYYCNFACHAEWAHLRLLVSQSQSQLTASMALPRDNGLSQFSLSLIITSPFCMHALER